MIYILSDVLKSFQEGNKKLFDTLLNSLVFPWGDENIELRKKMDSLNIILCRIIEYMTTIRTTDLNYLLHLIKSFVVSDWPMGHKIFSSREEKMQLNRE